MSETVNDYHGYSRKNRKCSTPLKKPKPKPSEKSPPGTLKPEFSRRVTQQFQNLQSEFEDDNSSFGSSREHEHFKINVELGDGDGGDASKDDVPVSQAADDRQEIKLPRIESNYFDLIEAGRRDQITLEPEDVDHDLIAELAKSLSCRDPIPAADFEKDPITSRIQGQSVHPDILKNSQHPGFLTRRVKFGSAAMLAAGALAVLMVNSQELPGGGEEPTEVALATSVISLKPDPVALEKPPATPSLSAEVKNSEASSETRFVPAPVLADVSETISQPESVSVSQADQERAIKIENLNKNLKIVRAYLSSQQLAYSDAALDEKPKLAEEVTKIKSELTSLVGEINALQPPVIVAPPTEVAEIIPVPGEIEKIALEAIPEGDSDDVDVAIVPPVTVSKPRNPAKVELALAAMPGLYRLQPAGRSRLKEKLISGECLVPALSSVFSQVPALVMRDMMRQFEGQC